MILLKSGRSKRILKTALVVLLLMALWQAASLIVNQPLYIPSPAATFTELASIVITEAFWLDVAHTFYRVAMGLALSFVLGIALAYVASRVKILQQIFAPIVLAIKSTPVVSIIFLTLVWFSASFVPVVSCVLLCFPIFYTNTLTGITAVDKELLEMAAVFGVRQKRVLTGISVPSVMPYIYSALSVCLGFSWKSVVAAEVLSSPKYSMGYNLFVSKRDLETTALFAWTLAIIIISLIVEKGLKRLLPGGNNI